MVSSIKKAFVLCVKALKLFYVLAAVNLVINIVNVLIIPAPAAAMSAGRSFLVVGFTVLFSLVGIFVYGGALAYVRDLVKTGAAGLASFIDNGKKYFLRLLAITLIVFAALLLLGILSFAVLGLVVAALKPLISILMILLFAGLIVLVVMPGYVLVVDDAGIVESIKKGILVGKKNFFEILGILVIMILAGIVIMLAASLISGVFSFMLKPLANYIVAACMAVSNAILTILLNIAFMDFYLSGAVAKSAPPKSSSEGSPQPQ